MEDSPFTQDNMKIAVIGLGYVGLPLALALSHHFSVKGLDVSSARIVELQSGEDRSREVEPEELAAAKNLSFTTDPQDLAECTVFIITVPTPIDDANIPDLGPLVSASKIVGSILKPGDVVIYESTVYPGATEEVCVPTLEQESGLGHNCDFFSGYSPERINPGDPERGVSDIIKVTSGSTPKVANFIDELYSKVITAGTFKVNSIRVAEAAKIIENIQRDINIALINELAILFNLMGIDTLEVLEAAGTKWNFLPFRPGLVGGHCIGVDPYYLTHKAQALGFHPEMISAGRRINDRMGAYISSQVVKLMIQQGVRVAGGRALVLGLTFKENCPDLRNSRTSTVINDLVTYGIEVEVYDPWADPAEARREYGITPISELQEGQYDAVIVAVAHRQFEEMGVEKIRTLCCEDGVVYDVKSLFPLESVDGRL